MIDILERLKFSKFRSSFHLKEKDIEYIKSKGIAKIKSHAIDFVNKHLADPTTFNDGKQTPMRGHPVFIAQHATATCCRGCLYKWHQIEPTHILNQSECNYIVDIIMTWINSELEGHNDKRI